jgi:hypothetical protein
MNYVLIFIIFLSSIFGEIIIGQPKPQLMKNNEKLALNIRVLSDSVYLSHPLLIEAVLINNGDKAVLLNSRMAVGYENMPSRELYVKIVHDESNEVASYREVDINRDFSPPQDFRQLAPADSLKIIFDLFEFYQLTKPGKYRLTVYYQASEPLAHKPDGLYPGTVSGNALELNVLSGE